ncbi:hypothetical protein E5288_WYG008873 [Bos mutus]|uniref:Uncharacterized protein n=1 Tax=Bos mutus TaxID=72004 RepID=A0A6B0QX40_9CETA|nr:hypothetical protein [Bos mutus]
MSSRAPKAAPGPSHEDRNCGDPATLGGDPEMLTVVSLQSGAGYHCVGLMLRESTVLVCLLPPLCVR